MPGRRSADSCHNVHGPDVPGGDASSRQCCLVDFTVSEVLGCLDRVAAALIKEEVPDATANSASEEPPLPLAHFSVEKPQHLPRPGTGHPLRLGHEHRAPFSRPILHMPERL